jgi:hypothetical protein
MVLQIGVLWANAKKALEINILTIERPKVTLNFGHTFKFLKTCARPEQAAKNGNF